MTVHIQNSRLSTILRLGPRSPAIFRFDLPDKCIWMILVSSIKSAISNHLRHTAYAGEGGPFLNRRMAPYLVNEYMQFTPVVETLCIHTNQEGV